MSKRQRRTVLSEEDYVDSISSIIQRDYFPDSKEHPQQHFDDHNDEDESAVRKQQPSSTATLTSFHAAFTSEDNADFSEKQKQELEEKRKERERLYLTNYPSSASSSNENTMLLLASDQFTSHQQPRLQASVPVENALFFPPSSSISDKRALQLMPPPPPSSSSSVVVAVAADREKRIEPSATRFPKQQLVVVSSLPSHYEEDASTIASSTEASTDLDEDEDSVALSVLKRQAKRRERETLVQMTPRIEPQGSPLVTWGSVAATPVIASTTTTSAFEMKDNAKDVAANKALQALESRKRKAETSQKSLSKAALSLLRQRPESARSASSFGSALRSAYSSSSARLLSTRRPDAAVHAATPRMVSTSTTKSASTYNKSSSSSSKTGSNVTDGLLNLDR